MIRPNECPYCGRPECVNFKNLKPCRRMILHYAMIAAAAKKDPGEEKEKEE